MPAANSLRNSHGGTSTTFTWDVAGSLPVVLDDGNQYVYGAGLTAMKQSGSWYYYLADGLGSTTAVADASGAVQDSYTYDVYGTPPKTGSLANEFDFAGQQTDGTGLQYLRARYYDPATGTFLSREPLASLATFTSNPMAFVRGNPQLLTDDSGLYPIEGCEPDCSPQHTSTSTPTPGPASPVGTPVPLPLQCSQLPSGCAPCLSAPGGCQDGDFPNPNVIGEYLVRKSIEFSMCGPGSNSLACGYNHAMKACAQNPSCSSRVDRAAGGAGLVTALEAIYTEAGMPGAGATVAAFLTSEAARKGTVAVTIFEVDWWAYKYAY